MNIGKNWKIESDVLNVTLYKRRIIKATDEKPAHEVWKADGYFSSIKGALKALVDLEIAETGLKDLRIIVEKQEELYKLIERLK